MTRANPSKARLTSLSPVPFVILRFSSRRRSSFRESRIVSLDFYPTSIPSLPFVSIDLCLREREKERRRGRESKRFRFKQKDLTSQLGIDGDRHDARILINFLFFDRVSMPPLFLPSLHPHHLGRLLDSLFIGGPPLSAAQMANSRYWYCRDRATVHFLFNLPRVWKFMDFPHTSYFRFLFFYPEFSSIPVALSYFFVRFLIEEEF